MVGKLQAGCRLGATTLSITTFRITTLSIIGLFATLSISDAHFSNIERLYAECPVYYCYAECRYADCHYAECPMLNVVMLSVVALLAESIADYKTGVFLLDSAMRWEMTLIFVQYLLRLGSGI